MPFELTNARVSFQNVVNSTLTAFLDKYVIAYLDNIPIYSDILDEH